MWTMDLLKSDDLPLGSFRRVKDSYDQWGNTNGRFGGIVNW